MDHLTEVEQIAPRSLHQLLGSIDSPKRGHLSFGRLDRAICRANPTADVQAESQPLFRQR